MKKPFKNSATIKVSKTWFRYTICYREYLTQALKKLLADPDQGFNGTILKDDGTTTRLALVEIDGRKLVIKRYNIKSFKHALKRALQPTRAVHCWRNAHRLLQCRVNTPQPIAIVEKRFGFIRREGYFIYEYVSGINAEDFFTEANFQQSNLQQAAKKLALQFQRMYTNSISHNDMKITNFIFVENKPFIIDLDGMRKYLNPLKLKRKIKKDLQRFMENWQSCPNINTMFSEILNADK